TFARRIDRRDGRLGLVDRLRIPARYAMGVRQFNAASAGISVRITPPTKNGATACAPGDRTSGSGYRGAVLAVDSSRLRTSCKFERVAKGLAASQQDAPK